MSERFDQTNVWQSEQLNYARRFGSLNSYDRLAQNISGSGPKVDALRKDKLLARLDYSTTQKEYVATVFWVVLYRDCDAVVALVTRLRARTRITTGWPSTS